MKKFEIINSNSNDIGERFGISHERRKELARMLNELVRDAQFGRVRIVQITDTINHIREFCQTEQEHTWCIVNHIEWLYRTGRMLRMYQKN